MLGLKIAITGVLFMLLCGFAIKSIGEWPGIAMGLPLVAGWLGGIAAAVLGILMAVWGSPLT